MDVAFLGSFIITSLPHAMYPEIAIAGRSNVGKSSFLNAILGRRRIAHVSSTPGKTRTINLYLCDSAFVFADLPGYGYSKVSKAVKTRWTHDLELYLRQKGRVKAIILLVDIRHFPVMADLQALDWLVTLERPLMVVLTKADKLRYGNLRQREAEISGILKQKGVEFTLFSAKTGTGRKEIWNWIETVRRL